MFIMVVDLDRLGQRMLEFRKSLGYSQKVVAEKTGIGRSFISHIEAGSQRPSFEVINKLLNSFNISIDWLLTGRGQMLLIEENNILNKLQKQHIEMFTELNKLPNEKQIVATKLLQQILELMH